MKYITIVLGIFVASVQCQNAGRPPRPPPSGSRPASQMPVMGPRPTSVTIVSTAATAPAAAPALPPVRPVATIMGQARPEGCSPGCGPTEICAKLGDGYCRLGQMCSVCIKMESIRFPASALAGMFTPPSPTPGVLPPGALPPGALPPGALPPGALPPGALPPGAIPPGLFQQQQNQFQAQQQQMNNGMNSFSYDMPQTQNDPFYYDPPHTQNDPFGDLFGFGNQQPQQNFQNQNSFMPLLFFEGLGFGGLGF